MSGGGVGSPDGNGEGRSKPLVHWARSHWDILALAAILVVALAIRLTGFDHLLAFDEAWNVVTAEAGAAGKTGDFFFFNFYRHPPLYLGLSIPYCWALGSCASFMKIVSILASLGVATALFFLLRKHQDRVTAVLAAFFFAVVPVAVVFDTWIKQDSIAILFGVLFMYAFLGRRYYLSGVFLGLGFLTKEIMFFVLLSVVVYTLATFTREKMLGLCRAVIVGFVMSAWWFVLFSNTGGDFIRFFLGTSPVNARFQQPLMYYIQRFPVDFGWIIVIFMVGGIAAWVFRRVSGRGSDGGGEDVILLCLIWVISTATILTVSRGKPVWMIYSIAVPVAALAGYGLKEFLLAPGVRKPAAAVVFVLVVAGSLTYAFTLEQDRYMANSGYWGETEEDYEIADELNQLAGPGDVLLMSHDDISPNLAYYTESYSPGSIARLPLYDEQGRVLRHALTGRIADTTIYLVEGDSPLQLVFSYIERLDIDWVMIKERADGSLSTGLAQGLEKIAGSIEVDGGRIFSGRKLREAVSGEPDSASGE